MNRNKKSFQKSRNQPIPRFHPEHQQLLSIFNSIDEVVYVTDPKTYEVLFANKALKKILGEVVGQKCYQAFQGLKQPCPFCTNKYIFGKGARRRRLRSVLRRPGRHRYYTRPCDLRPRSGRTLIWKESEK